MFNTKKTIEDIFAKWGVAQRQTPLRNDVLKSEIIGHLQTTAPAAVPVRRPLPRLSLAFAMLAVVVLVAQQLTPQSPTDLPTVSVNS